MKTKPNYVRTPEAMTFLGVCKTTLYSLADFNGGYIKTVSLKKRGKTRGVRLWSLDSMTNLLEGNQAGV